MHACMLPNWSKTTGRRVTELRMPTKHLPGKVLNVYSIAILIGSTCFPNPILRKRSAMATNKIPQNDIPAYLAKEPNLEKPRVLYLGN